MNTTKEQRKEKAIELLKKLEVYKPYINGFKHGNKVCYFENYAGFWAYQDEELQNKIKEIEERYSCTVYAITHELFEFGECYSFLIVTNNNEEWDSILEPCNKNKFYAFSYVWNKDVDYCSEFGTIQVQNFGGGIRRCA